MLALTTIANEFPLLAAIADELGETHDSNKVARLQTARRLLQDAFYSLEGTSDNLDPVSGRSGRRLRRRA